jgi:rhodanese-related sulfurtransferase
MRKYYIVLVLVLPILVLVLIKTLYTGNFRNDAARWAEPSVKQSNMVTHAMLSTFTGNALMVDLSERGDLLINHYHAINIPAKFILDKNYQKKLRAFKGTILLVSENPAMSARVWMLLSQMGFTNVYILSDKESTDVFKYKFRPDTISGPEL